MWVDIYGMSSESEGWVAKTKNTTKPFWTSKINSYEHWKMEECIHKARHTELKMVLKFLFPIVYPDKPTRVSMTIGSTVIGAYKGIRWINWASILSKIIEMMTTQS